MKHLARRYLTLLDVLLEKCDSEGLLRCQEQRVGGSRPGVCCRRSVLVACEAVVVLRRRNDVHELGSHRPVGCRDAVVGRKRWRREERRCLLEKDWRSIMRDRHDLLYLARLRQRQLFVLDLQSLVLLGLIHSWSILFSGLRLWWKLVMSFRQPFGH